MNTTNVARLAFLSAALVSLSPLAAQAQIPDRFSWGNVQSHPLAAPGEIYEGLPDGNYLTPNEDQAQRCLSGCILYATTGAMEMMFKILHKDPQLTLNLDEGAILDAHGVQNGTDQTNDRFCNCDCSDDSGMTLSCVPQVLSSEGLTREGVSDGVVYTIDGYDSFGPSSISWDALRNRILRGPIAATIEVDATAAGQKYLNKSECTPGFPCTPTIHHRVLIVGWAQDMAATGGAANRRLEIKNSWGDNEQGFSSLQWLHWDDPAWYKSSEWLQVEGVAASNTTIDSDADTIPNYRDICPTVFSGRLTANGRVQPNLDNDAFGDECDPDMDGDHVYDLYDCSPYNRYIGYDLDQDGLCDNPAYLMNEQGNPVLNLLENLLYTPAFKDYKDAWTRFSASSDHAEADGDDDPSVDLSLKQVCQNQCNRLATIPWDLLPGGFSLSACLDRCDPTVIPRDSCTPMGAAPDPSYTYGEWHHCNAVWKCATVGSEGLCDQSALPQRASTCRNFWHNPGEDGQFDGDGDGIGDFCDEEPIVKRLSVWVETDNYKPPGDLNVEMTLMQCYDDRYKIQFDTWGGRSRDGQTFGVRRDGVDISACYCPGETWDAVSCQLYCPALAETPNSGSAEHNPGPNNMAWDPISDPDRCMSKQDINAGLDHHLCDDRSLSFLGDGYEYNPPHRYRWRWQPFYDPDRTGADGVFEEHPSPLYTESNPGHVKIRVSWPNQGQTPGFDEKLFSEPIQMKAGCFFIKPDLGKLLRVSPEQIFPPSSLYAPRIVLPGEAVSDFERLDRPEAALALFGEHLVAINPMTGAILGASAVAYDGSARLDGAVGANMAAMGAMTEGALPSMVAASPPEQTTPVIVLIQADALWLGFPALGNKWMTWSEAFPDPDSPQPAGELLGVVANRTGALILLARDSKDGSLVAYQLQRKVWIERARLPKDVLSAEVSGYRLALDSSARQLLFVGGEGPGFDALVHRWDLLGDRLLALPLPELEGGWAASRKHLGVRLDGGLLYLVGSPGVARVSLLNGRAQLLSEEVPEGLGDRPFVYVQGDRLSVIPLGTGEAFDVSTLEVGSIQDPAAQPQRPTWISRSFLDNEEHPSDAASGMLSAVKGARLIFKPKAGDEDQQHRARLISSSPTVVLRIFDSTGNVIGENHEASLTKELLFTPTVAEPFYVIHAFPSGNLDPSLQVTYELAVEKVSEADTDPPGTECGKCDEGCSCGVDGRANGASWLAVLLALLVWVRRRARH